MSPRAAILWPWSANRTRPSRSRSSGQVRTWRRVRHPVDQRRFDAVSPQADDLKKLHLEAAANRGDARSSENVSIDHVKWARYLLGGVDERRELPAITTQVDDLSIDDAYAIQAAR